jgi:CBS domain-containing protein
MMGRDDLHLDAMLRHLGAAYYDSLHGRAAAGDVTRAVDQVAMQMGERSSTAAPRPRRSAGDKPAGEQQAQLPPRHHGRWHSRVRDVMTTDVITVDRITPFKEIAALLVEHRISGVPVLVLGRHVAGVVTEGDLIASRDEHAGTRRRWTGTLRHGTDRDRYLRLTAEKLMTSPAVTIYPDATISAAASMMSFHHVKLLPVVDPGGKLVGLVSRRDLLRVFLVPDSEIARQVRELLAEAVPGGPEAVRVAVHGGIVTLTAGPAAAAEHGSIAAAVDLAWDIDGVVDIIDHTMDPLPA